MILLIVLGSSEGNLHAVIIGKTTKSRLLFEADLAIGLFTVG
jgi:hypothetical protein